MSIPRTGLAAGQTDPGCIRWVEGISESLRDRYKTPGPSHPDVPSLDPESAIEREGERQ